MKEITIQDIRKVRVGQAEDKDAGTGCTVILCREGAVAGVDVRGGGPATRETDLLNPINMVEKIHAVCLSGGSAYGLDAAGGVMQYLEEHEIGFDMKVARIPIVCGASLFDLSVGNPHVRPDKEMGYQACMNSELPGFEEGNHGAGTGASVGKMIGFEHAMKSGIGTYGVELDGIQVVAIVAVNACGNVVDFETNELLAGMLDKETNTILKAEDVLEQAHKAEPLGNTTIGCIITNAKLSKAQCTKVAGISHNGYARAIQPVHTMSDGDTIFVLSTQEIDCDADTVGILAVHCMGKAINRAVCKAKGAYGLKAYCDIK